MRVFLPAVLLILAVALPAAAGETASPDAIRRRIDRLEAQNRRLQSELSAIRSSLKETEALAPAGISSGETENAPRSGTAPPPSRGLLKPWTKGDYRIVPYGIGWLNMAYDTSRTATGPFVLFVESADTQGEDSFNVNARATRLGLDVTGPEIFGAESRGRVEFDFFGQAPVENRAGVLLRHAYGEFRTDQWRLLGGQTWDLISPLWPTMLNYTVGWGGGNIGLRRAQLRLERYIELPNAACLTLQGSINRTIVTDFATEPLAGGEDAGWPTIMGRAALKLDRTENPDLNPEIGLSGHIGEEAADFEAPPVEDDRRFLTWSFNLDLYAPVNETMGFQGEFFVGEVLGTFQGGIVQGIDPVRRNGIRSIGGWAEVWYYLSDRLHAHLGLGIDDPLDEDLAPRRRSQNQFYFGNLICDVTELFRVGLEVSRWETRFVDLADGEDVRIETVMQYEF